MLIELKEADLIGFGLLCADWIRFPAVRRLDRQRLYARSICRERREEKLGSLKNDRSLISRYSIKNVKPGTLVPAVISTFSLLYISLPSLFLPREKQSVNGARRRQRVTLGPSTEYVA